MLICRYLCDSSGLNQASHILLRGVPTTATSGDLRRAVMLAGVKGVTEGEFTCILKSVLKLKYFCWQCLSFISGLHLLVKLF